MINIATEIGDTFIIPATVSMTHVLAFSSWEDDVQGETDTRLFSRYFRCSLDSIHWSEYIELTEFNLSQIPVQSNYEVFFEFKYIRSGTDTTGELSFNYVRIIGELEEYQCGIIFERSVFHYFFDCCCGPQLSGWCNNVFEKTYRPGIVPIYIDRGSNDNYNQQDRDYIDFWRTVTCYYSLLVNYARQFESFDYHKALLIEYLRERGLYVCDDGLLIEYQYLMREFYSQIHMRGTHMIAKKKGDIVNGQELFVDGELLRLLCYNRYCDEFLFSNSEFDKFGWVVDKWGGTYKGIGGQTQFNKTYETSPLFEDISRYPIINPSSGLWEVVDGILNVGEVDSGTICGIGTEGYEEQYATNIDPSLTYCLSFQIKVSDTSLKFTTGVKGFDINGGSVSMQAVNTGLLLDNDVSMFSKSLAKSDVWYHIKIIIFPDDYAFINNVDMKHPIGTTYSEVSDRSSNLKRGSISVCKIIPFLYVDNTTATSGATMSVKNFMFTIAHTPYSTGFVQTNNFVQIFAKDNSQLHASELVPVIKNYLLSYKSNVQLNLLP